jgi:hypothetical protein
MSLILTHLNRFGIIHASDSNLTSGGTAPAGQAKKTFPVTYLNAGLTVAGAYTVGEKKMDEWMQDFIATQRVSGIKSLKVFASLLGAALEDEMHPDEKKCGSMVHIAGYVKESGRVHPEFYFVRNIHQMDPITGGYLDCRDQFLVSEDFWTRDCPKGNLISAFHSSGVAQIYINGYPPGRVAYLGVMQQLTIVFSQIWSKPEWQFRPPRSLAEMASFVRIYMSTIGTLFEVSDYPAPYIGGKIQICKIPCPRNTVTTC